ncbi:Acyl-protein thioesterase 1 [Anabarilius grahami]|uniref:Acyl-protein thioesterase 1 n=1 Tax=Anabarilius grahami TaxID=495550 RepID=A0A3N0YR12_ANAGA|nr:Acyl-protein thioesterase 1 [Anabarilius grahami]
MSAIVPAACKATAAVIFLHGLGDTGKMNLELKELLKAVEYNLKLYWKNNRLLNLPLNVNYLNSSAVKALIDREVKSGIPSHRIVLGGFSQRADGASEAGGCRRSQLLVAPQELPVAVISSNKDISVLQCHGEEDPLVPLIFGSLTVEKLKMMLNPSNITFKTYPGMAHSACPEEMMDIKQFIEKQLPPINQ